MDAKSYCSTMQAELVGMKAKVYDIISAVDKMPNKEKLTPQLSGLYALVADLSGKLDALNRECPAEWSAAKKDIEASKQKLVSQIDIWDREHIAGGYVGG